MPGKTLFIDYDKCIGCETCESVCRFLYELPRIHMVRIAGGIMAPLYCQHCDNPKCRNVCKKGAITRREDGTVALEAMLCAGCEDKPCLVACPYGAIFTTGHHVLKCDMCARRRERGLAPACVEMCPCEAIVLVDREELESLETEASRKAFQRVLDHVRPKVEKPAS
ncbi:MAG: 4Fe-4S binding protein [Desulfovibrionaceae bacterium]|jgi:Fe-S-cluster-containing dehydrogenase component|nr:4Fe-4S binding protein [Desulfovibrionaceae bacterium]